MKPTTILSALLLLALAPTVSRAQLVESENFLDYGDPYVTFNITLTQTGPVTVLASDASQQMNMTIDGTSITDPGTLAYSGMSFNYTTTLTAGSHTLYIYLVGGLYAPGGATLIAPDEPASGSQSAIDTLDSEVATLQTAEAADAGNISALQSSSSDQASQIAALQTAEAQDASEITALQTQLQAVETTLQNEITQDEANIATLQSGQTDQTGQIAALQQQVNQLQAEVQGLQTTLASIQPSTPNSSNDSEYTNLQNQINGLKNENKDQWITIGGVGLLGAAGTVLGAYDLGSPGDTSTAIPSDYTKTYSSYNPYGSTASSPYSKKN